MIMKSFSMVAAQAAAQHVRRGLRSRAGKCALEIANPSFTERELHF
jgi:hypothetical protein